MIDAEAEANGSTIHDCKATKAELECTCRTNECTRNVPNKQEGKCLK